MYKYLAVAFLLFSLSQESNSTIRRSSSHKKDLELARNIVEFFRHKNNKSRIYNFNKIITLSKHSKLFKNIHTVVKNLKQVSFSKKFKNVKGICHKNLTQQKQDAGFLEKRFRHLIALNCHGLASKGSNVYNSHSKKFFDANLRNLISIYPPNGIENIFETYKESDQVTYKQMMQKIENVIDNENIGSMDKSLWKLLPNDNKTTVMLNKYYQHRKHEKKFFHKEFRSLYYGIKALIEKDEFSNVLERSQEALSFYSQNKDFLKKKDIIDDFIRLGKYTLRKNKPKIAKELFYYGNLIQANNNESIFNILLTDVMSKDFESARKTINRYKLVENFSTLDSKLKFWVATTYDRSKEQNLSKYLYKKIVRENPLSYYGVMALYRLNTKDQSEAASIYKSVFKKENTSRKPSSTFKKTSLLKDHLNRLSLWSNLGEIHYSKREIKDILNKNTSNFYYKSKKSNKTVLKKTLYRDLLKTLSRNNDFLNTFPLALTKLKSSEAQTIDDNFLKYLYPMVYFDNVQKFSGNLNPLLVQSLIRQESAFNPKAISRVGARGLMQLMPATARSMKRKIKLTALKEPKTNIQLGTKYLNGLIEKYEGNVVYSLAAYNAGMTNVNRWRKQIFKESETNQDLLVTIELIPFNETNLYVKFILRNLFFYETIRNNLKFNPNIKEINAVALN